MAEPTPFPLKLKASLPEQAWPWTIAALRKDGLVWQSLQDPEFWERASNRLDSHPRNWSPANLALIALDLPWPLDNDDLGPHIRAQAIRTYEDYIRRPPEEGTPQLDLAQAGLLALALVARWNRLGTWKSLTEDFGHGPLDSWRTPLACLYGMSPEPLDLIQQLVRPGASPQEQELGLHALLCNPLPPEEQTQVLYKLLKYLPPAESGALLQLLERQRPEVATRVADLMASVQPTITKMSQSASTADQIAHITHLLQWSEIYRIADQTNQVLSLRNLTLDASRRLQRGILGQLAASIAQSGDLDGAMAIWQGNGSTTVWPETIPEVPVPDDLILALLDAGRPVDAMVLLPEPGAVEREDLQPVYLLASASLALSQGDLEAAHQAANQALDIVVGQMVSSSRMPPSTQPSLESSPRDETRIAVQASHVTHHFLRSLTDLFIDLDLTTHAAKASDVALQYYPNDPNLLATLARARRGSGQYVSAVEAASLAVTTRPDDPSLRYELVDCLEAWGNWESALAERTALLDPRFASDPQIPWPSLTDLRKLAACALRAGQPQRSVDTCQQILASDPADGLIHATLGEALEALGETDQAVEHFHLATQMAPDQPEPWLALARTSKRSGQIQKAIDTLRAAASAVPGDSQIHLDLAELYLEEGALTQALSLLHRAHELASPSSEIAARTGLRLGETLYHLGHVKKARQVLDKAFRTNPSFPGLAYMYARALLALEDAAAALEPLGVAVRSSPDDPGPYLDYARALLAEGKLPKEAVRALHMALKVDPEQSIAKGLLAEALAASGDLNASLQAYYHALETDLAKNPEWRGRLSFGLGRVTLDLGQPEIAVAALQEAARSEPLNSRIHRYLCEAYTASQLTKEALEAARQAVRLVPDDLDMLSWFAEQAVNLGAPQEAIPALTRALQLEPNRGDLLLRMGQIHTQIGDPSAARDTFKQLLSFQNSTPEELTTAAHNLLFLDEPTAAVACLERALESATNPDLALWQTLATAYHASGQTERGLEALDRALALQPNDPDMYLFKTEMLLKRNRLDEAREILEQALEIHPGHPGLLQRLALILRGMGKPADALASAEQAVTAYDQEPGSAQALATRALAADLARTLLQPGYARSLLVAPPPGEELEDALQDTRGKTGSSLDAENAILALPFYCLAAELSLDAEEEVAAAKYLTRAYKLSPDHLRVLALQTRLFLRQGNSQTANQNLQNLLECAGHRFSSNPNSSSSGPSILNLDSELTNLLAVTMATLEFHQWDVSLHQLRQAIALAPHEPHPHLELGRVLVVRAEYQRLCQSLDAVTHAPGEVALGEHSYRSFQQAIQNAARCISPDNPAAVEKAQPLIQRWRVRGQAVFKPGTYEQSDLEALSDNPEDSAARIALLWQAGDLATIAQMFREQSKGSQKVERHHLVQVQFALSLGYRGRRQDDLGDSLDAVHAAIEQQPKQPLYHALLAYLAQRERDYETALKAIQAALFLWPDEPRWHTLAASLHMETGDTSAVVDHLEQAAKLEPNYLPHHLALGEACLKNGEVEQGIRALEQARRLAPDQIGPYFALAHAHLSTGNLASAASCAESAITMAPDQAGPLLLSAEIALRAGDAKEAQYHIQSALRLNPNDTAALHLLARALEAQGHPKDALNVLDRAISLSSLPLPLLLERARLVEESQGVEAALDSLQELAAIYPEEPAVLAGLANALANSGQSDEAILAAQRALHNKNGELAPGEKSGLHYLLGRLLRQAGQLDQAIYQLDEAIRYDPGEIESYLELAGAHLDRRQYSLALQTYQKAISAAPNDPRPYYQAAMLLKESRDYRGAEQMLRLAADLARDDLNIRRQLGALVALNLVHNRRSLPID